MNKISENTLQFARAAPLTLIWIETAEKDDLQHLKSKVQSELHRKTNSNFKYLNHEEFLGL
jgi:hypothetical protein